MQKSDRANSTVATGRPRDALVARRGALKIYRPACSEDEPGPISPVLAYNLMWLAPIAPYHQRSGLLSQYHMGLGQTVDSRVGFDTYVSLSFEIQTDVGVKCGLLSFSRLVSVYRGKRLWHKSRLWHLFISPTQQSSLLHAQGRRGKSPMWTTNDLLRPSSFESHQS